MMRNSNIVIKQEVTIEVVCPFCKKELIAEGKIVVTDSEY